MTLLNVVQCVAVGLFINWYNWFIVKAMSGLVMYNIIVFQLSGDIQLHSLNGHH